MAVGCIGRQIPSLCREIIIVTRDLNCRDNNRVVTLFKPRIIIRAAVQNELIIAICNNLAQRW